MALLKFKKGVYADLATTAKSEGTVYITTDEKAMYVDINDNTRIRIGQIITLTQSEWENMPGPFSEDVFYYITNINALIRWNGMKWVQINSTKDLSDRIKTLEDTVGDSTSGLVKTVATHDTDISNLKTTVGNSSSGLVKKAADLQKQIDDIVSVGGQPNVIEKIRINGASTDLTPDSEKRITLGKIAGLDEVQKSNLSTAVQTVLDKVGDKLETSTYNADKEALNTRLSGIDNTIGTGLKGLQDQIGTGFDAETTVTKAIGDINGEISSLKNQDTALNTSIQGLRSDLNTLSSKHDALVEEVATVRNIAEQGVADAASAQSTANQAVSDAAAAQSTANQAVSDAANAQDTANQALTKANGNATDISTLNNTTIPGIKQNIKNLEDNKLNAQTFTDYQSQLSGTLSGMDQKIGTNTTDIGKLNTALSQLKTDIGNVTNIMNFIGVADKDTVPEINDDEKTVVTINGKQVIAIAGDVVIAGDKEYVSNGSAWIEFGDATGNAAAISGLDERLGSVEDRVTALDKTGGRIALIEKDVSDLKTLTGQHSTYIQKNKEDIASLFEQLTWGSFTKASV